MGVSILTYAVAHAAIVAAPLIDLFDPLRKRFRTALGSRRRRAAAEQAERQRLQDAVLAGEERLRILFERLPDAILLLDPAWPIGDWRIVDCNPAACRMNGYSRDELVGMSIARLNAEPVGDEAEVALYLDRLKRGEIIHGETLHRHKDGTIFPIEVSTSLVTIDGRELILGIDRDITERKRTEAQLRFLAEASAMLASSLDYETTLANVTRLAVPFIAQWCVADMIEPDGAVRPLAVAHADPAIAASAWELQRRYPTDPAARYGVAEVLRSHRPVLYPEVTDEMLVALARDEEHLAALRGLGLKSAMIVPLIARGKVLGALSFGSGGSSPRWRDIDLRLAEELGQHAALAVDNARLYQEAQQSAAAQAEFLSIAAHELRTPVTSLLGYIQLLRDRLGRDPNANPRDQRALRIMFEQGERLGRLINVLLDLGRIETRHFTISVQRVDLHALVRTVVRDLEPTLDQHRIIFEGEERGTPLLVQGDPQRLEQVFHNLLQNAIKYSPAGGPITVRLTYDEEMARVAVIDRGVGIPEAALPNLFQRFFRAENTERGFIKGMGIGLFLVHEIVTRHGGNVAVTSREGEGTTFIVSLPLQAGDRAS